MVSSIGTWLQNVTAGILMLRLTGSPFMVGLVSAATFLPVLLFSLPAGALSDRLDRRMLVAVAQSVSMSVAVILGVLAASQRLTPPLLLAGCFVIGTGYAVAKPALSAMLPALVPRQLIVEASAFNTLQFTLGQTVGPVLATLVLVWASPAWAFGLNGVSSFAQAAAVCVLPRATGGRDAQPRQVTSGGGGIRQGLRYIRLTAPMPTMLLVVVLCNGAVEALRTLAPSIATEMLHREVAMAGPIIAGYGVGAISAVLLFARIRRGRRRYFVLLTAFTFQAAGLTGIVLAQTHPVAVVLAAVPVGIGFSMAVPVLSGGLQSRAADAFRGRVMSTFSMAHLGCRPVFAVLAGAVASALGTRTAVWSFAALAALAAVLVRVKKLDDMVGN